MAVVIRSWNAGTGTKAMENSANYTGSGALLTTNSLVFSAGSSSRCEANVALSVGNIIIRSTFDCDWTMQGNALTLNNSDAESPTGFTTFFFNNPGFLTNFNGIVTFTSSGESTMNITDAGSYFSSALLHWSGGDGQIVCSKNTTVFGVQVAAGKTVTVTGANTFTISETNGLILGDGARFNFSTSTVPYLQAGASGTLITTGVGCRIGGTTEPTIRPGANNVEITLQGFTYDGSADLRFGDNSMTGSKLTLAGEIFTQEPSYLIIEGTVSLTSNKYSWGYLQINATADTVTLLDNLYCKLLKRVAGTFNRNGKEIYAWDNNTVEAYSELGDTTWQ